MNRPLLAQQSPLLYSVKFSEYLHHLLEIDLWLSLAPEPSSHSSSAAIEFVFPVWTPGSYMVREYTRNIEAISAAVVDRVGGTQRARLPLRRHGKNRWLVAPPEHARVVCLSYRLYCREMSVRTNWVESNYGFLTGAATFPYIDGHQERPIAVELELPPAWQQLATALQQSQRQGQCVRLEAANYDELVDAPIVCGNFEVRDFEVEDRPHYLVNVGGDSLWDLQRATQDVHTLVDYHQKFWKTVPYEQYWFLNLNTESRGGLEHDNSSVLMCSRWAMHRRESYLDWLALVSHEFFHTWNIRRLRPVALMHYDYEAEQFVEELWIAEGITSYFDDLALVRTGLCTRDEYLARLTKTVQAVQASPGRLVQDLRNASWDAWTKHYRPDENSGNSRISYYLKGAVVAWLLDVRLQQISHSKLGLAEVMRLLWERHLAKGYTLHDFEQIVEELGNLSLRQWLHATVREAIDVDYQPALEWFGLQFKAEDSAKKTNFAKVWIGSQSTGSEGKLWVRNVLRGSPSDRAGLNVDDELLALDGYRLSPDTWPGHLEMFEPEQELELLVSRRGKIVPLKITLGKKPPHNWELGVDPAASQTALSRLERWLRDM
jgi:predicted metalloprotease with PDZ domain